MLNWWNELMLAQQIFALIAIPSSLILAIQTVMLLLGIGDDGDADIDADWEAYKAALKTAGVEDLEKLLQQSYDLYLDAMPDMG